LSDICPYKVVSPTISRVPLKLPPNNTKNFKIIEFNIQNPVLLRLLVCKEDKINPADCPYPEHKNPDAVKIVCNSPDKLAHLYIRNEEINDVTRSCLFLFTDTTEAIYFFSPDGLLQLYKNTVSLLDIAQEKPFFHIILRYSNSKFPVNTAHNINIINRELKRIYNDHNDENICFFYPAGKYAELLRIDHTDNSNKFSIKPK